MLFYSKTGGHQRGERIDARVSRKIESGSQKCRWYASLGVVWRWSTEETSPGQVFRRAFANQVPLTVRCCSSAGTMLDLGEEQEKETWKMERRRSFRCVCLHTGLGPEGPPSV